MNPRVLNHFMGKQEEYRFSAQCSSFQNSMICCERPNLTLLLEHNERSTFEQSIRLIGALRVLSGIF